MRVTKSSSRAASLSRAVVGFVVACGIATSAWAIPITKQLVVNVIQICDNAGANCASIGPAGDAYFEAEVDKIWAQAGIDVMFVNGGTLNSTLFSNMDDGVPGKTFSDLSGGPSATTVNMWLTHTVVGVYGEAWLNAGGLVIAMDDVMAYNFPIGRLDTIAHELGHNLGLGHDDSNPSYLMASGGVRNVPGSLGDICPDGLCYDLLSAGQIATARLSSLLTDFTPHNVPEPTGLALVALGLLAAGMARRRRGA